MNSPTDPLSRPPLEDAFGRQQTYLRISVTDRCNLKCTYCAPHRKTAGIMQTQFLTLGEIERLARLFARLGVSKIRVTGGEPLLRPDLMDLLSSLSSVAGVRMLGMTTNGVLLEPQVKRLRKAGVTHLNISLDTLREDRFGRIALRQHFNDVVSGLAAALAAGFTAVKVNVVVMGGVNDDEIWDFVALARYKPLQVRFIEFMPFLDNQWESAAYVSNSSIRATIEERYPLRRTGANDDESTVAKVFVAPGFRGSLGFISPLSEPFCSECRRIRLTSDGRIKSCLFGGSDIDLRPALRRGAPDDALELLIRTAVKGKSHAHPPLGELVKIAPGSMINIGG